MKVSLSRRLVLGFLITILGVILMTSIISNYMVDQRFNEYLLNVHEKKVRKLKTIIETLYDQEVGYTNYVKNEIARYAILQELYIEIKDVEDQPVFSSGQGHLLQKKMMGNGMGRGMGMHRREQLGQYMEENHLLKQNGVAIGTMTIGYFGSWNLTERDIGFKNTLNQSFIISASVALIFGLMISLLLSRQLTNPLRNITEVASQMRDGNLNIRADVSTNTLEIAQLSQTMNHLAETLQNQEMLRKRLTTDMAHEIRTPLTTLQSHVEAFIDGVWEPTQEKFESCHEEILRLTKLVENLQDLAKLEQANQQLNKVSFDLSQEVMKTVEAMKPQLGQKSIQVETQIAPEVKVWADKDKMKQIILNLLSNAYKYSYEKGKIYVILTQTEENIEMSIKDHGRGISEKDLPLIFERFYRGDISRNRETGGAGIGLTITKTLVEAHGGKIYVESQIEKGCTFTILFSKSTLQEKKS